MTYNLKRKPEKACLCNDWGTFRSTISQRLLFLHEKWAKKNYIKGYNTQKLVKSIFKDFFYRKDIFCLKSLWKEEILFVSPLWRKIYKDSRKNKWNQFLNILKNLLKNFREIYFENGKWFQPTKADNVFKNIYAWNKKK